jgi:hypothetical protein
VDKNKRAVKRSSYADIHFAVLGLTLSTGEPLCCAVLYSSSAKDVDAIVRMGIQPWCNIKGDGVQDLEADSNGADKYYPYGPCCSYKGREVLCFVICTENGSITSAKLMKMLQFIDLHAQIDLEEATPFLLLDGHGSRFEMEFLNYINDVTGSFKIQLKRAKEAVLE